MCYLSSSAFAGRPDAAVLERRARWGPYPHGSLVRNQMPRLTISLWYVSGDRVIGGITWFVMYHAQGWGGEERRPCYVIPRLSHAWMGTEPPGYRITEEARVQMANHHQLLVSSSSKFLKFFEPQFPFIWFLPHRIVCKAEIMGAQVLSTQQAFHEWKNSGQSGIQSHLSIKDYSQLRPVPSYIKEKVLRMCICCFGPPTISPDLRTTPLQLLSGDPGRCKSLASHGPQV